MTTFKVAGKADTNSLAAAIAGCFEDDLSGAVCLHCIGPRSVSTGVKAVAAAKGMMHRDGMTYAVLIIQPEFVKKQIRGEMLTVVALTVRAERSQDAD